MAKRAMPKRAMAEQGLRARAAVLVVAALTLEAVLTGCGGTVVSNAPGTGGGGGTGGSTYAGAAFTGHVRVGALAVAGASVQVYAAGSAGNGSAGTALLSMAATTDATGAFAVATGYACPAASAQVYVVARGGSVNGGSGGNAGLVLLTALGTCSQIGAGSAVTVNEATTAAAAYALNQFLGAGAAIGGTATNATGMAHAFAMAEALTDPATGVSPGASFAANGSSPAATIDTVANLLYTCSGSATASCGALFAATANGGSTPTNTLDAALSVARNPAANVAAIYTLATGTQAYAPALKAAPADWTLYVDYTGGGLSAPETVGIDSGGNVWVAGYFGVASVFSALGKPLLAQGVSGSGLSASYGLAIDGADRAWITNEPSTGHAGNSVSVFDATGASYAGTTGFTAGGMDYPTAIAMDTDGSAWVADYGNSRITHLSSTGAALSGATGYGASALAFPVAIAVDASHTVWAADESSGTVTKMSADGSSFASFACCNGPSALAVDGLGNVWVANYYGDSVSELSAAGAVLANGSFSGGGLSHPQAIAVDGANNLWLANYRGTSITELAGASAATPGRALSPAAGLGGHAAVQEAYGIAVDASGNVWVSDAATNTLTEFVGLATPARTPAIGPAAAP